MAILVVLFVLQRMDPFPDEYMLSELFRFGITLFSLLILALYSVYACRKSKCWPLFERTSIRSLAKEFFVSSWLMFLILLACGIILFIPAMILKPGMKHSEVISSAGFEPNSTLVVALLVVVITLGPIAEELFFRGFLYNALKSRLSMVTATVLQAVVFSAFHRYDLFNSLRVFLFGVAFVIIYEKRKKLISPISAHVFVNAVATLPMLYVTAFDIHP